MEKNNQSCKEFSQNEVSFKIEGKSFKPYLFILLIIFTTLVQILSSKGNDDLSVVVTLYFSIAIIAIGIYKIGFYGVFVALLSSLIFSLTIKQSWQNVLISVGANTIQALIIYLVFKFSRFPEKEDKGIISLFKIGIILLGLAYVIYNLIARDYFLISSSIILCLLILLFVIKAICHKQWYLFIYVALIAITPNLVGSMIGSLYYSDGFIFDSYLTNFLTWFFSNSILLLSFGFFAFDIIRGKFAYLFTNTDGKYLTVNLSTLLYFVSILLWNIIFYILFYLGWLNKNLATYIFPWLVGNLFFVANFALSFKKEIEADNEESYKWFEGRSIVAENNTQMLVAIIALLLPLCATFLGKITQSISVLFILNITTAIISVGLIWIPKNMTKYMSTIKNLKTVFHLFTVSLLLLNIVLIINESIA